MHGRRAFAAVFNLLFSQKVRVHGDSALTKYLEDLGAVSLHHTMLGTSFHLRDQLADRLGMPEFPARSKEGLQPRLLLK